MTELSRTNKVLALSIGQTLTTLSGIVSGMILARILTKTDYATIKQTFLAYNFVAPILMLGLPNALYYFLPRNENRQRGVTLDNILLLLGLAIIFSLFMAFGGYHLLAKRFNNTNLETTLKWMIFYPIYMMPVSILGAVLVYKEKVRILTFYNIFTQVLLGICVILAVLFTYSYSGPLIIQIILPAIFAFGAMYLIFSNLPKDSLKPSLKSMIEILKYSVPLGVASMIGTIMLQWDKIIVSAMCTPEEFANYVNGAMEIPLIGIITGSISTIILADMSKLCHNGNKDEALRLFKTASIRSSAVLFPVMIFLLITAKPFIIILYSSKYIESIIPFTIFLLILPVRTVMYGSALMALGKTNIILYRSLFDLIVNAALSILFVHFWGYLGAAIATVTTLYIWTIPYNLYFIG
ncbi:MAG: oligosaccharide flippase family protein, partial [Bacteroidales bacterium]|nr:oligosaccharide flippase family protein [Bacteroidales bacterium]